MDNQRIIMPHEERVYKIQKPFSEASIFIRKHIKSDHYFTVEELLKAAGINTSSIPDEIKTMLDQKVSQVCRAGSRFSKGCICVELYDDGEKTAKWAIEHGALFCITKKAYEGIPCLSVDDTMKVFAEMCGYIKIQNSRADTTAVIGSIGKTTTKRMIAAVYSASKNTYYDPENENQLDCVGTMVQHIPSKAQLHVQEVSEDTPGCARLMSTMLKPHISVITAIDESHYEAFGSQEGIIDEILGIEEGMTENGVLIINKDDPYLNNRRFNKKTITVSLANMDADYYAQDVAVQKDGLEFKVCEAKTGNKYSVKLNNVYARHNIYSALQAFAAGVTVGIKHDEIVRGLNQYRTVGKRQNVFSVDNGSITIYADCYNAVAKSVGSALEGALKIPVTGKRIAVLGDIEEAGVLSQKVHIDVIGMVNSAGFDYLFCYGEKLEKAIKEVSGCENLQIAHFSNKRDMASSIKKIAEAGDLVLFKASRKSKLEDVIKLVWPNEYNKQMLKYYIPIIKWRFMTIIH